MAKEKKRLHHIEIEPAENGHVVTHHYIVPEKDEKGQVRPSYHDYPNHKEQHVMDSPEEVGNHVEKVLTEHEDGEEYAEPEETVAEERAEPKRADKNKKVIDHHSGNNPMGVGRKAPNRQY